MSKNKVLIPELRFPEFVNDGEWESQLLGKVLKFQTGFPFDSQGFNQDGNGIRLIKNRDLKSDEKVVFYKKSFDEKYLVYDEDILVGMDGDFTPCVWQKGKALLNQRVGRILTSKKGQELFFYYFLSIHLKTIEDRTARTTVKHLSHSDVEKIYEPLPKPKEQQKIASCLSSLDKVIATQSQKLELLKDHKKGLMQNLFPQEGETAPKYRFPEFANDGKWIEKTLNEVATFLKGKGISKSDIAENGSLPCIRYGELYTHYKETIGVIKSYTNLSADGLVMSKANDVIIPASGETQIDIATASCVLADGIALGGDLNIIRTKINGVFLSYLMNNVKKKEIAQLAQGISVVHLYSNQLKTLKINIPKPKEQQKIASCLSALDELITSQVKKIEHLKQHKKGLMQGLFPKMND